MRIIVVGGSGHIGSYLVPRLVRAGHDLVSVSRGTQAPYTDSPEWRDVTQVVADRQQQDADGRFGATVLAQDPDVVVDLVSFTLASTTALVEALRGRAGHLLHCGSIWRYGPSLKLPIREGEGTRAIDEYGTQKEAIARYLQQETRAGGLVTTSVHPGHIVGPGWAPINPLGNLDPSVWAALSAGRTLRIPGSGAETLHHVHADDVAQVFELAVARRDAASGEDFHAVAPSALTVRGYAEIAAGWFGRSAHLEPVSWEQFRAGTTPEHAQASWGHLHRSQYLSIEKAQQRLGYRPAYEPEAAILESVRVLVEHDRLPVEGPLTP
ncbi:NAD(P)-dependent oxidoreductase [Occultella glacieicola]|uniref:NAD(P)-dependent oxidoreductase n=1 Tax=Occultella glacieicola TaxID=2518684 RepID=A0ABY2E6L8_9MICO|nr:NAD(P)-dependent oxidoreductase [Occultella glacieicola]TDE97191.1 NAD(P)-dependent oxidoreductase [Occultella glacieicola]